MGLDQRKEQAQVTRMLQKSFSASDKWLIKFGVGYWKSANYGNEHLLITLCFRCLAPDQSRVREKAGSRASTTHRHGRRSDSSYLLSGFHLVTRLIQQNSTSREKWTIYCFRFRLTHSRWIFQIASSDISQKCKLTGFHFLATGKLYLNILQVSWQDCEFQTLNYLA